MFEFIQSARRYSKRAPDAATAMPIGLSFGDVPELPEGYPA
jgi:hypothetical protein